MGWWPGPGKHLDSAVSFPDYWQPAQRAIIKFWALHKTENSTPKGCPGKAGSCAVWVALGNQPSPL